MKKAWRPGSRRLEIDVETNLTVRVLAFLRHRNGFLTAMHDVLAIDGVGFWGGLRREPSTPAAT